jgi:hypothetical protein
MAKKNKGVMGKVDADCTEQELAIKKALKDKKNKRKELKKAALKTILDFAKAAMTESDTEVKAALQLITVRASAVRNTTASLRDKLIKMIGEAGIVHEDRLWNEYKVGRAEMRKLIVKALKNAKPEERLWVKFDIDSCQYTIEGEGPNPPANWNGYKPLSVEGEEIL